jgi:hypothetical protein
MSLTTPELKPERERDPFPEAAARLGICTCHGEPEPQDFILRPVHSSSLQCGWDDSNSMTSLTVPEWVGSPDATGFTEDPTNILAFRCGVITLEDDPATVSR